LRCKQLPTSSACRVNLGARIELFVWLPFPWQSVSFSSLDGWLGCPAPTQAGSAQQLWPIPTRQRWNFPSIYLATRFVQEGWNLPRSCTGLCGSSRADDVVCLLGGVSVSLGIGG
jgi:hypothetical protein